MTRWLRIGSLALLMGVAACSSTDKGGASTGQQPAAGEKTTVKITASKGGTVSLGSAALDIPAGSLGSDVEVTVQTVAPSSALPDSASLTGLLYDFGPDGTTFNPPATLALPLAATPATGQEAVVAFLDEKANQWVDLRRRLQEEK